MGRMLGFFGVMVAGVILAENVLRNIWINLGASDGPGGLLRTLGVAGTAAAIGSQQASSRRGKASKWVKGQGPVELRSNRMWDNIAYIVAIVAVIVLLGGGSILWGRKKKKSQTQHQRTQG